MSFTVTEMNSPLKDFRPESLCLLKESQEDYWRYARKGPHDFSVYTEKSSIYEPPAKEKFRESSDVLVRWTDGLLYLATIIQVEDEFSRCAVKFEDGSQFWALYKDIYKGPPPEGEIACTVCDTGSSQPPDEIVICDKCSVGYHQLCHIPRIDSSVLRPDVTWSCRKCIFAIAAKKGGAVKKGHNAQLMMIVKQMLPYNPQALSWDGSHRTNLQQTYCYCGGPGEWHSKMLQCSRCKQWFHEACIQCLEEPLLYGDRFYIFVCSVCNRGPEFIRRLPLRWPDIAHLVLFNLSVIYGKKYFDFDTTIMTFLKENWSQFLIKGESASRMPTEEKRKKMLDILQNCKSRFCSGKEIKKKTYVWGLRSRVPPPVPIISIPQSGAVTNDVLDSFTAAYRKPKPSVVKSNSVAPPIKKIRKALVPDDNSSFTTDSIDSKSHKSEKRLPRPKSKRASNQPKRKVRRKLPHRMARYVKNSESKRFTRTSIPLIEISDSEDTISSHGTLNSIIPHPTDFEGSNNPFMNNYSENTSSNSSTPSLRSTNSSKSNSSSSSHSKSSSSTSSSSKSISSSNSDSKVISSSRNSSKSIPSSNSDSKSNSLNNNSKNNIRTTEGEVTPNNSLEETVPSTTKSNFKSSILLRKRSALNYSLKSITAKSPSKKYTAAATASLNNAARKVIKNNQRLRLRVRAQQKSTNVKSGSVIDRLLNEPTSSSNLMSHKLSTPASAPSSSDLNSSVSNYFGASERIANGEKFSVLAKRIGPDGNTQYLVEWDGVTSS